ncbi:MAG: 2-oxoacid:acceptor oxidoreductase subunit alpha [Actinomycetota bacterium]|nr:2-oxoacid:acceptor oxidoreductase subunit alpha [Actinomycetota bacterium]
MTLQAIATQGPSGEEGPRINDFSLKFANVNGTGSASANNLILRAIFRMGVPVSGKNLFPSNIQGLPTWYEIRVNGQGHTSRSQQYDMMVAMNGQTYAEDIGQLSPGGYVLYDSTWPLPATLLRQDVNFLGVPLARMCGDAFSGPRERILMKNIAYAGAVSYLIGIDPQVLAELLEESYSGNQALRDSNQRALRLGYDYAEENLPAELPFRLEPGTGTEGKILIDGNTATALGCLYAGATVAAWYPITPATSVAENFRKLCERYRRRKVTLTDGTVETRNDFVILQAEDELAALGMVIGASWAGARAFTSTSGPGISLMNELLGLAYYTEIPAVVIDVQRTGPSTGMPTRVQQSDLLECAYASHGDTKHILLLPADPKECFDFAVRAFDLAERFQTPVMLLSDLDIGMNDWAVDRFSWDDGYRPDRGRVLTDADIEKLGHFYRYGDEDAEYVTPRTLPGLSEQGAYFTRGSGHDRYGLYTEESDAYAQVVERLAKKVEASAAHLPEPVIRTQAGAAIGVITMGSCEGAVLEALEILASQGTALDYMRVRGFPFDATARDFITSHERCLVVEQNRDAQLRSLLVLEAGAEARRLGSILSYGGLPISATQVVEGVRAEMREIGV